MSKIKLGLWFLKKGYYAQLVSMIFKSKKDDTRKVSTEWCDSIAVSEDDALRLFDIPVRTLDTDHSDYFEYAEKKINECPFVLGGGGSTKVLYSIVCALEPNCVIETGVAYGWSSLSILLGIKNNPGAHLWSIDMPYPNLNNDQFVGCAVKDDLKAKWTLLRKPDLYALPEVLKSCDSFDFCHYDSDKSYKGRMRTANLIWEQLSEGGFFMMDDINDNLAFKEFCELKKKDPVVIRIKTKFAGVIRK